MAVNAEKEARRKAEIIGSACALFASRGYRETTMQDIAEAAGYSKGGVYYYFASKEEILFEIHERFINEGLRRIREVEARYGDPEERFVKLIETHLEIIRDYKDDITLFYRYMDALSADNYERVKRKRDEYERVFADTVREGVGRGVFETEHVKLGTMFILGSLNSMHTWYNPQGDYDVRELARIVTGLWLNGL